MPFLCGLLFELWLAVEDALPEYGQQRRDPLRQAETLKQINNTLKVVTSEKHGGSVRWQMIDIGLGPW
jgi:hypothetical protein